MKFDNEYTEEWKNYYKKRKRITIKIHRGDYCKENSKRDIWDFDSEEDLNKALNSWLHIYLNDIIEEIVESDVYEFDYGEYSKQYE